MFGKYLIENEYYNCRNKTGVKKLRPFNEIDKITYLQNIWILGKWNIFLRVPEFQSCAGYS